MNMPTTPLPLNKRSLLARAAGSLGPRVPLGLVLATLAVLVALPLLHLLPEASRDMLIK